MESSYKPEGYNSVSPYLVVNGAAATIAFLVEVFGAVKLRQIPNDEGKLIHAEVRIDDTVVMIADGGDDWSPIPCHVHIYVSDVDATYKRAIAAGAMSVQEPINKKDDEDKRGGVKDAGGTTWWIATKVE
jgi:PhnB protein